MVSPKGLRYYDLLFHLETFPVKHWLTANSGAIERLPCKSGWEPPALVSIKMHKNNRKNNKKNNRKNNISSKRLQRIPARGFEPINIYVKNLYNVFKNNFDYLK